MELNTKLYIYRVENANGRGPYRKSSTKLMDSGLKSELRSHSFGDSKRLLPVFDIGRKPYPNEICGFASLEQVIEWFPIELLRRLSKYDFYLRQIEVSKITAIGELQCLAIR